MGSNFCPKWFEPSALRKFSRAILQDTLIFLRHFLKQTKNPFKKYFPHTEQRLIGVEPSVKVVWKKPVNLLGFEANLGVF